MRRLTIGRGIALALAAISLLVVAAYALLVRGTITPRIRELAGDGLVAHALLVAAEVDQSLAARSSDIATRAILLDPLDLDMADLGSEAVRLGGWLDFMRRTLPEYAWIGIADPTGNVLAATERGSVGTNVAAEPWFRAGLVGGFLGDLRPGAATATAPDRLVDLATPVRDGGGRVVGVLGAQLSWSWMLRRVAQVNAGRQRAEPVGVLILAQDGRLHLAPPGFGDATINLAAVREAARSQPSGYLVVSGPGDHRSLVGFARPPGASGDSGLGWLIAVQQDLVVAEAPGVDLDRRLFLVGAVCLLAFGAALVFVGRAALAPVSRMVEAADGLRSGAKFEVNRRWLPVEFQRLADSIESLVTALQFRERQLEEAYLELDASFQSVGETFPGVLMRQGSKPDGTPRYLYLSPSTRKYFGVTPEEVYADPRRLLTNFHPEDRDRVWDEIIEAKRSGGALDQTYRVKGSDGVMRWFRSSVFPRMGGDGDLIWDGVGIDVSELQAAKAEAETARAAAEGASAARLVFFAAMSHEIRTPMNAILGFTRLLLQDGATSPGQRRQLAMVFGAAENLLVIINNLLDFAKGETGNLTLIDQPFDLRDMLESVVGLLGSEAQRKGLHLVTDLDPVLPRAFIGDETKLRQVLINLVANAVKFTEKGRITVQVRCVDLKPNSAWLRFAVIDTGIGIPRNRQADLFAPFSQVGGVVTTGQAGTGLGLAICRQIVTLMGGRIEVESEIGRGSRFGFAIEMRLTTPVEVAARRRRAHQVGTRVRRPRRVLLAEDQLVNQELARAILGQAQHTIHVVSDGQQAVEAFLNEPFDVILMDLQMPVMDGITATARIRTMGPAGAIVPIIAVSAQALPEEIDRALAAGFSDVVTKPIDPERLLDVIERLTAGAVVLERALAAPLRSEPDAEDAPRQILDPTILRATAGMGDSKRFVGLRTAFLSMVDMVASALRAAVAAGDVEAFRVEAHKLSGSAGSFGLLALGDVCRDLETTRDLETARAGLDLFEATLNESLSALATWSDRSER